jgi:hypothetical protein
MLEHRIASQRLGRSKNQGGVSEGSFSGFGAGIFSPRRFQAPAKPATNVPTMTAVVINNTVNITNTVWSDPLTCQQFTVEPNPFNGKSFGRWHRLFTDAA